MCGKVAKNSSNQDIINMHQESDNNLNNRHYKPPHQQEEMQQKKTWRPFNRLSLLIFQDSVLSLVIMLAAGMVCVLVVDELLLPVTAGEAEYSTWRIGIAFVTYAFYSEYADECYSDFVTLQRVLGCLDYVDKQATIKCGGVKNEDLLRWVKINFTGMLLSASVFILCGIVYLIPESIYGVVPASSCNDNVVIIDILLNTNAIYTIGRASAVLNHASKLYRRCHRTLVEDYCIRTKNEEK
jgi:hypothetical protein